MTSLVRTPEAAAPARASCAAAPAWKRRLAGLAVALAAAGVLGVAAWLEPSAAGLGTHRQLAPLPACGWIATMNCPCPTCGMTTAFAHAANGHLLASFLAQPLGCVLAIVTAMCLLVGGYVATTGSRVHLMFGRLFTVRTSWIIVAAVLMSWGYKVLAYKGVF